VRRGAASCRAVRGSRQWRRRSGPPAQVPSPRSRPGWPSAPRRCDPGEVGRPAGVAGARMSGRRPGWSLPCPRPVPPWDVRPAGRADVQRPVSGVQASGVQVSGRTGLRCPRHCRRAVRVALDLEWLGVGPPGWAHGSRCPRCPRAVVACIGPDGKRWCGGWPCPAAPRSTVAQGRRLAGVPAAAPPGRRADTGWSRARVPAGWGARDAAGAHRSPRRASGRSPAWCPTMGLDQRW
jgi:hypothetical protein